MARHRTRTARAADYIGLAHPFAPQALFPDGAIAELHEAALEVLERLGLRILLPEARQFLAHPSARGVVAVTCASRLEMLGVAPPDAAADGEMRFRNPAHPAAKVGALGPAVKASWMPPG